MYALRQPNHSAKSNSRRQRSKRRKLAPGYHPKANNYSQVKSTLTTTNSYLQKPQKLPVNLQVLLLLQKSSFGIALLSMATSLGLYIATVRIPPLWSQEYRNLESLQQQERQLTAINETLKYQLARDAKQQNRNLSRQQPQDAIFLTPAPINTNQQLDDDSSQETELVKFKHTSLGY